MKTEKHESDILKYLALVTSIVIGIINLMAIFEAYVEKATPVEVHWLTIVLIFLAGMTMLADPLKDTPLAAAIAMITLGALAGLLILFGDLDGTSNVDLFGIIIPLWIYGHNKMPNIMLFLHICLVYLDLHCALIIFPQQIQQML